MIAPTALIALLATSIAASGEPAFEGTSEPIAGKVRERIVGSSWHRGCPVGLGDLRLLRVTYWGFDDQPHNGRLVVNARYDRQMIAVMKRLYKLRYPIRRMQLVDQYGADDDRSMAADNTSAFNCRFVAGRLDGRCTHTGSRSTSTRSRTPTSPDHTCRRRRAGPLPTARETLPG